ncbi:hypothetical protein LOTGIDRAFT_159735 [Lottia gigantea]|uniref:Uncharacterized protein n=1 Tax=Lottia gigantea TaxID=225164 RepID=V4AIX8_LOTGI|nr:hypothetical protein LOTGIDRAFT_159735 [Lottia gigantea]ESO96987.1 hypothetical protein LOTGIDRAFT_159735 [Lottia gigantea]
MAMAHDLIISDETLDGLASNRQYIADIPYTMDIFPDTLSKPNKKGKAKDAEFEELDLQSHKPYPMVFRIGPNTNRRRMWCWLKAFWVFYKYLKEKKDYDIIWENKYFTAPPENKLRSIDIIVNHIKVQEYRVCFFVTTGTVHAQGKSLNKYEEHFPVIKRLFQKMNEDVDELTNDFENAVVVD